MCVVPELRATVEQRRVRPVLPAPPDLAAPPDGAIDKFALNRAVDHSLPGAAFDRHVAGGACAAAREGTRHHFRPAHCGTDFTWNRVHRCINFCYRLFYYAAYWINL